MPTVRLTHGRIKSFDPAWTGGVFATRAREVQHLKPARRPETCPGLSAQGATESLSVTWPPHDPPVAETPYPGETNGCRDPSGRIRIRADLSATAHKRKRVSDSACPGGVAGFP